jgi:hypothetical protein
MAVRRCVVLYGDSVFLGGIRTGLEQLPHLDLVTVAAACHDAAAQIVRCRPDAVVFDRAAAEPSFAPSLLDVLPGLVLIGVDPSSDRMLVLTGRQEQPASVADLVRAIGGTTGGP